VNAIAMDSIPSADGNGGIGLVILPDRVIRPYVRFVQYWDADTTAWVAEHEDAMGIEFAYQSWDRDPSRIWFGMYDGSAMLYDWVAREVVRWVETGVANIGIWYWAKHDVFLSLHRVGSDPAPYPFQTRVWQNAPAPASVSNPAVSPSATAGRQHTVTSRLLGSDGEPCADEVVTFATDVGTLGNATALTDDDGYASTTVVLPASATGDVTVDAEVEA
jgi:hypothetical protein